uniref:uncharacterized protein PB18E9.04c-like n=1 Tax=Monopterus albus TaxID=43700 RepID=UPI0009B426C5|nr:uncharacterized protein PB18E9.04c-like [Monopterus albus]
MKSEMKHSYTIFLELLRGRMEQLIKVIQKVNETEREGIQKRMAKLKQLQQVQQLVNETAEKARNISDLPSLLVYTALIDSQLKDLPEQDLSPPQTMAKMRVVTDKQALETIFNLGELEVLWIPFSVSATSSQDTETPATASSSSTTTSANPASVWKPLPQTGTSTDSDSAVAENPVSVSLKSSSHQVPLPSSSSLCSTSSSCPSSATLSTPTYYTRNCTQLSLPASSCRELNQPSVPVTATSRLASSQPGTSPSSLALKTLSHMKMKQDQMLLQIKPSKPVSTSLTPQPAIPSPPLLADPSASCAVLSVVPQSLPSQVLVTSVPVTTASRLTSPQPNTSPSSLALKTLSHMKMKQDQMLLQIKPSKPVSTSLTLQPAKPSPPLLADPSTSCAVLSVVPQSLPSQVLVTSVPVTMTSRLASSQPGTSPCSLALKTLSHMKMKQDQMLLQIKPSKPVSTSLTLQPAIPSTPLLAGPSTSYAVLSVVPQSLPSQVLVTNTQTVYQLSLPLTLTSVVPQFALQLPSSVVSYTLPRITYPQQHKCSSLMENAVPGQSSPASVTCEIPPVVTAGNCTYEGQRHVVLQNHKQTSADYSSPVVPTGPLSALQGLVNDIRTQLFPVKQDRHSHVVKAAADSACDHGVQQVEAKQQDPAENEPTSTMSEEPQLTGKLPECEMTECDTEELSSVTGQQDSSLSEWQPRVILFRLPLSLPPPGRPLPSFRVLPGDNEDEIYLEEMSNDSQSNASDVSDCGELLSPQESPVALQIVSCSACGSANASIICLSCGRGYHRTCHVPPIGPDIWSEWVCSLCQDLSDPSDPYSSERPQRPPSPCLSVLEQRRCESLLLYLKIEGCSRLSQSRHVWSRLKVISERLTLQRSPPYLASAEFISDVWSVLRQASFSQDDDVLNKLRESFQIRSVKMLRSKLHSSLLTPPHRGGDCTDPQQLQRPDTASSTRSKLKETRKRLREFLTWTSEAKRMKKDEMGK